MKTKFNGILTLLLALVVQISFAQDKTISGTVSDESGPLPGVTILKKGTTQGTETDFDGNYSIKAKTGDILVFSFVGMETMERTVDAANVIDITMKSEGTLDEVIVVGYSTTTKQAYTGTAKVVKADVLETKSFANVTQALTGEVAGVNVINTSGQPGTSATIRIRGFGSVNGNRSPLYVVDGVPLDDNINSVNPSDIESTTILKDATATAIYGSRGANGVVLITTKKGKSGATSIDVDLRTGVNYRNLPRYSTITNPDEYLELSWQALYNNAQADGNPNPGAFASSALFDINQSGIDPYYNYYDVPGNQVIDPTTGKINPNASRKFTPENWADYAFQPSIRTEANVKFSGGNDKTKYFSSFGYLDDQGYIVKSKYKRLSTRLNIEHKPKDWLKATANLSYTNGVTHNNGQSNDSGSIFLFVDNIPSIYGLFLRDAEGNKIPDVFGGFQYDYGKPADTNGDGTLDTGAARAFLGSTNGLADANYNLSEIVRNSFAGNFAFDFTLSDNLSFKSQYGVQTYDFTDDQINNPFYGTGQPSAGTLFKQSRTLLSQNLLNMLTFNKNFGDHNLTVLLASETNQWKRQRHYVSRNGVVNLNNGLDDPGNYVNEGSLFGISPGWTEENNLESYFTQANYDYLGKYFFSGSLRRDGSSVFKNKKWGTFWSAGASWIVTKENFMRNVSFINSLKLKASYGVIGDRTSAGGLYNGRNGFTISNSGNDASPISLTQRNGDNPDLTWEESKVLQTGIEFSILDNKIEGSLDYYNKTTSNMFFTQSQAPSIGFANKNVNDGELRNSGIEFELTNHIINKENFKFDLSLNAEFLDNEILKMPTKVDGNAQIIDQSGIYGRAKGHSIFDFHTRDWAGVDPADGFGMWYQNYDDINNNNVLDAGEEVAILIDYLNNNPNANIKETVTKVYSEATQRFIGKSAIPKVRGAFRLNAQIHDFSISTQFTYALGGYSYDSGYASLMDYNVVGNNQYHTDVRNAWQQPGDLTNIPRLHANYAKGDANSNNFNRLSSRFITKSDFLALNNVNIGYTLPSRYLENSGLTGLSLSLSGDNLFALTARDGFNPSNSETGASSVYRYPPLTTIALGVKVKF